MTSSQHKTPATPFKKPPLSSPAILSLGFLAMIVLGTCLLKLPLASHTPISWLTAGFTATSAVTVTGLSVVDTANFTRFGHWVIMGLIQFGGLGFMTFAILVLKSVQGKMGMRSTDLAKDALGQHNASQLVNTAKSVIAIALISELMGAMLLFLALSGKGADGAFEALFLSVSAFNNAGFALTGDNLMAYVHTPWIALVVSSLIITGGIGFLVIMDVAKHRCWARFSTHSKVMLSATAITNILAFGLYYVLEYDNMGTLGGLSTGEQMTQAWFMAVTTRTAGFNGIDIGALTDASTLLSFFLMFIGAGSMSTGGGIKIGTFVIVLATTWAYLRQREQVILFGRAIGEPLIKKSFAVMSIYLVLVLTGAFALVCVERDGKLVDSLFEVISASATVGLSRNYTATLSPMGQIIIMIMMFVGRLGPLTLAYFIATPKPTRVRYPTTQTLVG